MTFQTLDSAQKWAKQHGRHIFVELDGLKGVLEVFPGGRTIWRAAKAGRVYQRYRDKLTPDQEFRDSEYDHMKQQKDEILQRQREAIERPLLAEIDQLKLDLRYAMSTTMIQDLNAKVRKLEADRDRLLLACKASYKLPRPWMVVGNVSWPEWDAVWVQLEHAIDGR